MMVQAHEREIIFCGVRWVFIKMSDLAKLFSQVA
jgi:hypothetical protein